MVLFSLNTLAFGFQVRQDVSGIHLRPDYVLFETRAHWEEDLSQVSTATGAEKRQTVPTSRAGTGLWLAEVGTFLWTRASCVLNIRDHTSYLIPVMSTGLTRDR